MLQETQYFPRLADKLLVVIVEAEKNPAVNVEVESDTILPNGADICPAVKVNANSDIAVRLDAVSVAVDRKRNVPNVADRDVEDIVVAVRYVKLPEAAVIVLPTVRLPVMVVAGPANSTAPEFSNVVLP